MDDSLIYKSVPADSLKGFAGACKQTDANWKRLMDCAKRAREANSIVGRVFTVPVADGKAAYQVVKEMKTRLVLQHCTGLGDDWKDHRFKDGGSFPKEEVMEYILREERFNDLFSRREGGE